MATEKTKASAYDRGATAYRRQKPLSDNPYHTATSAMAGNYQAWERGWEDARLQWIKQTNASFNR